MATNKYEVYYEHTNSGLPEGAKIIATFIDKQDSTVRLCLDL